MAKTPHGHGHPSSSTRLTFESLLVAMLADIRTIMGQGRPRQS